MRDFEVAINQPNAAARPGETECRIFSQMDNWLTASQRISSCREKINLKFFGGKIHVGLQGNAKSFTERLMDEKSEKAKKRRDQKCFMFIAQISISRFEEEINHRCRPSGLKETKFFDNKWRKQNKKRYLTAPGRKPHQFLEQCFLKIRGEHNCFYDPISCGLQMLGVHFLFHSNFKLINFDFSKLVLILKTHFVLFGQHKYCASLHISSLHFVFTVLLSPFDTELFCFCRSNLLIRG